MRKFFADKEAAGSVAAPGVFLVKFAAVITALSLGDFAEQSGIDPIFHLLIHRRIMQFKADLQKSSGVGGGFDQFLSFFQRFAHRFFAQNSFAVFQTTQGKFGVQMVGRSDDRHFY